MTHLPRMHLPDATGPNNESQLNVKQIWKSPPESPNVKRNLGDFIRDSLGNPILEHPKALPTGAGTRTAEEVARQRNIHLVFSTGCEYQHDWQSVGVFYTARRHMPYANSTRLISCYHASNEDEVRA